MKTILELTPQDHGRRVTAEEWETAQAHSKLWKYEVIDGVIQVTPPAGFGHDVIADWLNVLFTLYRVAHPDVVNHVSQGFAVRVPGRSDLTEAQPDLGLYCLPPLDVPPEEVRWADIEPFLVVEIISEGAEQKDTVRNVDLYRQVPGILEYWIIDPCPHAYEPRLTVHRRTGVQWQDAIEVAFGEVYTTPMLPGFSLLVDPRAT